MNEWGDFFVATAGAAAALTGLIFVGVSISLSKILSIPTLPNRALISLILLLTVLMVSLLFLIPDQSKSIMGIEAAGVGFTAWAIITRIDLNILNKKERKYKGRYGFNMALDQLAGLPYCIGGISMAAANGKGMYWIVGSLLISFIKAVLDAWVLLVEINR